MGLRDTMREKPWIGWTISGVLAAVAAVLIYRSLAAPPAPDSAERRAEMVTIRCSETGEEWEMNRGQFEQMLLTMPGQIDVTKGLPRPSDGKLTCMLVDKKDWEETVQRINSAKAAFGGKRRTSGG